MEGTFPPSWFALLVIAGLIAVVGILTNSQILIVGAMVVGPEYGAILSLAFGVTRRLLPAGPGRRGADHDHLDNAMVCAAMDHGEQKAVHDRLQ